MRAQQAPPPSVSETRPQSPPTPPVLSAPPTALSPSSMSPTPAKRIRMAAKQCYELELLRNDVGELNLTLIQMVRGVYDFQNFEQVQFHNALSNANILNECIPQKIFWSISYKVLLSEMRCFQQFLSQ
jgi:hypothetical protein